MLWKNLRRGLREDVVTKCPKNLSSKADEPFGVWKDGGTNATHTHTHTEQPVASGLRFASTSVLNGHKMSFGPSSSAQMQERAHVSVCLTRVTLYTQEVTGAGQRIGRLVRGLMQWKKGEGSSLRREKRGGFVCACGIKFFSRFRMSRTAHLVVVELASSLVQSTF